MELLNKVGRERIPSAGSSVAAVVQRIRELQIDYVPILQDDTITAATLPHHHSDPFDRILIAQCLRLGCPVLTSDEAFAQHDVQIIW